jgi:putative phosphoribosyl transferase
LEELVHISDGPVVLEGVLSIPEGAQGLVLFAHGSGSSRHSPRNIFVAQALNSARLGTLLIDLLTREEDAVYEARFNIDHLTARLVAATRWIREREQTAKMNIGYFGASTGAAAALKAAAMMQDTISAVISRGGRADLAGSELHHVKAPVLLIVGGDDDLVIGLNQNAYAKLSCTKKMEIVQGASHLFEEQGKLEEVALLATEWFQLYLR